MQKAKDKMAIAINADAKNLNLRLLVRLFFLSYRVVIIHKTFIVLHIKSLLKITCK